MKEVRGWVEIKDELQKISKELEEKAFNSLSVKCTELLYDASAYVDDAIRKLNEAIERREIENREIDRVYKSEE